MSTSTSERPKRADRSNKLIRAPEAFRRLGMSPGAGYKAIENRTMPVEPIKVGGQWKFRAAEVDRVVDGPENTDRK